MGADHSPSLVALSRAIARALRHEPDWLGLTLDAFGFARVDDVLLGLRARGATVDAATLRVVVERGGAKRRFELSDDGTKIRALQGHSIAVDLGLSPLEPPEVLFHGTVARFLAGIRRDGLRRGKRSHVHLSETADAASIVGARRGAPVVLRVAARRMHDRGIVFFRAANGVWLTDHVPPEFLTPDAPDARRDP